MFTIYHHNDTVILRTYLHMHRLPINVTLYILHLVTTIAVMLSFGCVFPFLSFVLFLTIICQTKYAEYRVGQYLESVATCPLLLMDEKVQRVSELNEELRDIQHKVIRSLWQVVPCLGPFYGIFVFDIIGDASSMKEAIFAPVMLVVSSVVIYLIPYLHITADDKDTDEDAVVTGEDVSGSRNRPSTKMSQVSPADDYGRDRRSMINNNNNNGDDNNKCESSIMDV